MRTDLLQVAAELARRNEAFVLALVVRREPASSAQPGNMAVITERGEFHGWLGGSCIRPTVLREAVAAIEAGVPRLISLSPRPDAERRAGVTTFPMTCHSGGTVEIYLEPVMPAPRLLVFGLTPIAEALVRLGKAMGYVVDVADPGADAASFPAADHVAGAVDTMLKGRPRSQRDRLFAVVVTQGERDEEAAAEALSVDPAYVGIVASRQRFAQIRETLLATGVARAAIDRIRNPAGLDIDAKAPEEIALSILAEIVQCRRKPSAVGGRERDVGSGFSRIAEPPGQDVGSGLSRIAEPESGATATTDREQRDPVCGMMVEVATARHTAEHDGRTWYFCCGGCRQRFLAAPERYPVVA
jgi:xanthine dehydrogenase accessory factor